MKLESPLGREPGQASAKTGYGHWLGQRLSAVALVPLGLWFAFAALGLPVADYVAVAAWAGQPLHAIPLTLLLLTLLYHSVLGVQVVIEDYVHYAPARIIALGLAYSSHIAMAVTGIYAVFTLSFAGQA